MSSFNLESPVTGHQAKVDSDGRVFTKSDCSGRTVVTTRGTYTDSTVVPIAPALSRCCFTSIWNHGPSTLRIAFEATDPVSGDVEIASQQNVTLPFPCAEVIRGIGVGGGGTFVTIQARQPE